MRYTESKIQKLGQMDNTIDNTLESANRVYGVGGLSPTLPAGASDHTPFILVNEKETVCIEYEN